MPSAATRLNLWKQHLGVVPDTVWEQTALETLILADNDLVEISPRIAALSRLQTLDLGHNLLSAVPDALGDLDQLSAFLYLHDNQLEMLPASLSRLLRLRYLNISENRFATLPECVCGMRGLVELRASDNPLRELPDAIGQLTLLRELHLRNTKLTRLPDAIAGLVELRQIDLRGTPLTYLPPALAELSKLEKIDLRWVNTFEPPAWLTGLEARGCLVYR